MIRAMELSVAMRTAASTRRFRSDPVPDGILYRVLDNARFAPSGGNRFGGEPLGAAQTP
jgi:nitroreductase